MKILKIFFSIILLFIFLTAGCVSQELTVKDYAVQKCVSLCNSEKANGTNLDSSLCIGNPISRNQVDVLNDWVCDIAHNPRQSIDDLQENQCSSYREGKSKHFVELDEKCNVIKTY